MISKTRKNKYDVIIIGAGPAGLTAAIYLARTNLSVAFIEKGAPGGKMVNTSQIENYTGYKSITGPALSEKMYNHALHENATHIYGEVIRIDDRDSQKIIHLANGESLSCRAIIVAVGMKEKVPKIDNISKYYGKGVSFCAICDGPLYRNEIVGVIGGGDSAIEESKYLSNVASKVYIFIRKDHFKIKTNPKAIKEIMNINNIEVLFNTEVINIYGNKVVDSVDIMNNKSKEVRRIEISAIFPYIGYDSATHFLDNLKLASNDGFIITNEHMETKIKGIYAVGDVRKKDIKQIVTAASDGAIAAKSIINLL